MVRMVSKISFFMEIATTFGIRFVFWDFAMHRQLHVIVMSLCASSVRSISRL